MASCRALDDDALKRAARAIKDVVTSSGSWTSAAREAFRAAKGGA